MDIGSDDVKKIMKDRQCSLTEAHRIAVKIDIMEAIEKAVTFSELKHLVLRIANLAL